MEPTGAVEQQASAGDTILQALETLERRVQELMDELRAARSARTSTEDEVQALRDKLAERDRQVEGLNAQVRSADELKDDIRQRVGSLLDRMGEPGAGD